MRYQTFYSANSIYYEQVKLHLEKQSKQISTQLDILFKAIKEHNEKVDRLKSNIDTTIKNAFKKQSISSVSEYYKYYFWNVYAETIGIWEQTIAKSDKDKDAMIAKIDSYIPRLNLHFEGNSLIKSGSTLAEGKDSEEVQIIKGIVENDIFKSSDLLDQIINIHKSLEQLNAQTKIVVPIINQLNDSIVNEDYFEKAKCCPTIPKLIRKYLF